MWRYVQPDDQKKRWPLLKTLLVVFGLLIATPSFADHFTAADPRSEVKVSFEFPGAAIKETTLTVMRCYAIFHRRPLPKEVWVDDCKIDWWVFAALQDLNLSFKTRTVGKTGGPWNTTIVRIGDDSTGPDGRWVYSVNGIRSRYDISTQSDSDVKEIRFVYQAFRAR
jgi:hypothetical protein